MTFWHWGFHTVDLAAVAARFVVHTEKYAELSLMTPWTAAALAGNDNALDDDRAGDGDVDKADLRERWRWQQRARTQGTRA